MASSKRRVGRLKDRIKTDAKQRAGQYALILSKSPQISQSMVAFQNLKAATYFNEAFN